MLDFLEKFNTLPTSVSNKLSSVTVMNAIEELEKEYGISLTSFVMRVAIKEISVDSIAEAIMNEFLLAEPMAKNLEKELKEKVFTEIGEYLGMEIQNALPDAIAVTEEVETKAVDIRPEKIDSDILKEQDNSKPPFFFAAEDEEEIKGITAKISGLPENSAKERAEVQIDILVNEVNIHFSSEATASRFRQIMKTYFLGIRDRINTKVALGKRFDAGGLSLDEKTINLVLLNADEKIKNSTPGLKDAQSMNSPIKIGSVRDFDYDLKGELQKGDVKKKAEKIFSFNVLDTSHEITPPHPAIIEVPVKKYIPVMAKPVSAPMAELVKASRPHLASTMATTPVMMNDNIMAFSRPVATSKKVKMDDVVFVPQKKPAGKDFNYVMSPIDELTNMDVVSFRRLSEEPKDAAQKIKEKIQLLEDEEYSKKIEGIKGWRKCPIYLLYLAMGQESIIKKQSVEEVTNARKLSGKDYLTPTEFDAVMDLNKSLRF
jgi:hypothetical protein